MPERLQLYLPNFSPRESAPYANSEYIIAERDSGGDYNIYLTPEGVKKLCQRARYSFTYPFNLHAHVIADEGPDEIIQFGLTRCATTLSDPKCHNKIYFDRDEIGPIVLVAAWLVDRLAAKELPFIMTRYDGHTNKIWIRVEERPSMAAA